MPNKVYSTPLQGYSNQIWLDNETCGCCHYNDLSHWPSCIRDRVILNPASPFLILCLCGMKPNGSFYPLKEIKWIVCEIPTPGRTILVRLSPIYWPFLHYRQLGSSVCSFTWSLSSWPFSPLTSEGLTIRGTGLFVAGRRLMIGRQTNVRRYANLVSDILVFLKFHVLWISSLCRCR